MFVRLEEKLNNMKTKIQIKSVSGKVLFEYETENNTIKKTVEKAVLSHVNLRGSDLRFSDFRGSDLRGVNFRGSDLRGVNFRGSDLYGSDFRGSDLYGFDFRGSDLYGSFIQPFCKWQTYIKNGLINIGCEAKTSKEWLEWLDTDKEYETKRGTIEFKRIEATIRAYCAYVDTMGDELYKTK